MLCTVIGLPGTKNISLTAIDKKWQSGVTELNPAITGLKITNLLPLKPLINSLPALSLFI